MCAAPTFNSDFHKFTHAYFRCHFYIVDLHGFTVLWRMEDGIYEWS